MTFMPASDAQLSPSQLDIFRRAALVLTSSLDLDHALHNTIAVCLPTLGDFGFFDVILQDDVRRTAKAHQDPQLEEQLRASRWHRNERSDLNLCALSSGKPALHEDTSDEWFANAFPGVPRTLAFRSMLTVPLFHGEDLIGSLTLFMAGSERNHCAADLAFAAEIASLAAPVVVKARIMAQQRATEAALRASEQRFQLALRVGGMGAWQWDMVNNKVYWWPGMAEIHGLAPDTQLQDVHDYLGLVHPDDRALAGRSLGGQIDRNTGKGLEYRILWPDGSVHWVEGRGDVVLASDGKPVYMSGVCVDVTQRKLTEQRLSFVAQASAALAELVDHDETLARIARLAVPDFADWCSVDLLEPGPTLRRVAVAHADPAKVRLAHELHERYPPDPAAPGGTWEVIRSGKPVLMAEITDEVLVKSIKDPNYLRIIRELGLRSYIGAPLVARGKTIGVLAFISAESRHIYAAADVELAEEIGRRAGVAIDNSMLYRALRDNDRRKDEFLAMLGHELRNPLAPISSAAQMLRMAAHGDPKVLKAAEVIGRQVGHLSALVNDLLDVSRVTRGLVKLVRERVDLHDIVASAIEQSRPLLDTKRHTLTVRTDTSRVFVFGDRNRLVQTFVNLLNNAAKYTPEAGLITLSMHSEERRVCVVIEDNGIGIDAKLLPHIFDLFTQAERSSDRSQGGLGIGLALVKTIIALHDGEITAHSDGPGTGATFSVVLRISEDIAGPAPTT